MAKLTLTPLLTCPRLEKRTQHRLRVHPEWDFLHLHRFEDRSLLLLSLLFLRLLFSSQLLLTFLFDSSS